METTRTGNSSSLEILCSLADQSPPCNLPLHPSSLLAPFPHSFPPTCGVAILSVLARPLFFFSSSIHAKAKKKKKRKKFSSQPATATACGSGLFLLLEDFPCLLAGLPAALFQPVIVAIIE